MVSGLINETRWVSELHGLIIVGGVTLHDAEFVTEFVTVSQLLPTLAWHRLPRGAALRRRVTVPAPRVQDLPSPPLLGRRWEQRCHSPWLFEYFHRLHSVLLTSGLLDPNLQWVF